MPRPAHIFVSTGEVSGDLQGSLLISALYRRAAQTQQTLHISALGGAKMAAAGAQILGCTDGIGAVGLVESLRYVLPSLHLQRQVRTYLQEYPPDLVVLIDYAGVNLRMGAYLRRQFQVPILYYIAPQAWAVRSPTTVSQTVTNLVDEIIEIFPQAAQHFTEQGAKVTWVGHPFVDQLQHIPGRDAARAQLGIPPQQTAIALLPASRHQEMSRLLPVIGAAAQQIQSQVPAVHFWIPVSRSDFRPRLTAMVQTYQLTATLTDDPRLTLAAADLAINKSGTVNLEAALLGVPQVVLYRLSPLSYWIFRYILRYEIPFISPVNLILDQAAVPELLQGQATPDHICAMALALLQDKTRYQAMMTAYARLRVALGSVGCLERAAARVFAYLPP